MIISCSADTHVAPTGMKRTAGDICACGRARFCNQGWHYVELAGFRESAPKNCVACKERYKPGFGARASEPRRRLRVVADEPRFTWVASSKNRKLGGIPAVIVSPETCPPSCGFYGNGCYGEFGFLAKHWREVEHKGIRFPELLKLVRALPPGQLWRYAEVGDLPGIGDELDLDALEQLVEANRGRRGFTFTHKPLRAERERRAIAQANANGFTINLSADTVARADELAALGIGPVALVVPTGTRLQERKAITCLYEAQGRSCAKCQLCQVPVRRGWVAFGAHGQMAATVSKVARGMGPIPRPSPKPKRARH